MGATDIFLERLLVKNGRFSSGQISRTLQMMVEHGMEHGASGIHIEPRDRHILVRYRIGGTLSGMHKLPVDAGASLMQQVKLLAGLDPLEANTPQEGAYEATAGNHTVNVDVSIMPVLGGEKAVLHLSPKADKPVLLENLGFWGDNLVRIRETFARPYGLVMVVAPRRGGLSHTLRSLLYLVNAPAANTASIEIGDKPGPVSAAGHLKSVLYQNPNIIMIDNLPDRATAELTVQTSLQGRMMLAGVHAENAIGGLLRVRSLGVEPFLLMSAWRLAIGQRLVRRLCPECSERYELSAAASKKLYKMLGINSSEQIKKIHALEQAALAAGLGQAPLSSTPHKISHLWRAGEIGCGQCRHTGYKTNLAITEILTGSDDFNKKFLRATAPSAGSLHKSALKNGFVPIELDGLIKSLRGLTTIDEVLRRPLT